MNSDVLVSIINFVGTFNVLIFSGLGWLFSKRLEASGNFEKKDGTLFVAAFLNGLSVYFFTDLYFEIFNNSIARDGNIASNTIKFSFKMSIISLWLSFLMSFIYIFWRFFEKN